MRGRGAAGVDMGVFDHKVNTMPDQGGYVPPAALTDEEFRIVGETLVAYGLDVCSRG